MVTLSLSLLDSSHLPRWLEALLGEKFFNACIIHEEAKKNEKNIFCLDCCDSHRLGHVEVQATSASPAKEAYKTRLLSILSLTHFPFPPFLIGVSLLYSQIQHILRTEGKLSSYIFECLYLTLPESGFDDGQMTPDTVLEQAGSLRTSSGSSGSGGVAGEVGCRTMGCTATTEIARKKRSSVSASRPEFRPVCAPGSEISVGMMNRRKATPHRSPLY
ncbi:hypothetical protein ACSBR2_016909 [Camellia fascicularis]